jgi:hypothetical protein
MYNNEVEVKFSVVHIKQQAMKTWGSNGMVPLFLDLGNGWKWGGQLYTSPTGERAHCTHSIGGWMDSRVSLDVEADRKICIQILTSVPTMTSDYFVLKHSRSATGEKWLDGQTDRESNVADHEVKTNDMALSPKRLDFRRTY